MTGLPSPLRQPLRFQPGIHLVTVLITYWLSHRMCRSSSTCAVARNSSSTAFSSPMLLVPCGQPPAAQVWSSMYQAQPAGPGLPSAEPSAEAVIVIASRVGHDGMCVEAAHHPVNSRCCTTSANTTWPANPQRRQRSGSSAVPTSSHGTNGSQMRSTSALLMPEASASRIVGWRPESAAPPPGARTAGHAPRGRARSPPAIAEPTSGSGADRECREVAPDPVAERPTAGDSRPVALDEHGVGLPPARNRRRRKRRRLRPRRRPPTAAVASCEPRSARRPRARRAG